MLDFVSATGRVIGRDHCAGYLLTHLLAPGAFACTVENYPVFPVFLACQQGFGCKPGPLVHWAAWRAAVSGLQRGLHAVQPRHGAGAELLQRHGHGGDVPDLEPWRDRSGADRTLWAEGMAPYLICVRLGGSKGLRSEVPDPGLQKNLAFSNRWQCLALKSFLGQPGIRQNSAWSVLRLRGFGFSAKNMSTFPRSLWDGASLG